MRYVVIRESQPADTQAISEVVRKAYISNVSNSWLSALFNEVTFQAIILLAAFMFIFMGFPLLYCVLSVPTVLLMMYILIYGAMSMKAAELMYGKKAVKCWVAEAYDPYFSKPTQLNQFKIITVEEIAKEGIDVSNLRKTVVGTCAVMSHNVCGDWAWLFRLAVDQRFRKRGLGLQLTKTAQNWCRDNQFNYMELVITECQDDARQLFANAGFQVKQLYHKKLFTSVFTIQMFQLRCEIRPTFM